MTDTPTDVPHADSRYFRPFIGILCVLGSLVGFAGLYIVEIPQRNEQALLLALGIIFGWGSAVVQSEYGSTATGRKVADSAIRGLERQNLAAEQAPTGTPDNPIAVAGAEPGSKPVETKVTKP